MLESLKHEDLQFQELTPEEKQTRGILARLTGPIASFTEGTRNGRKYSDKLWEKAFDAPLVKEMFKNGGLPGELQHPENRSETDPTKIAIMMPEPPKKDSKGHLVASVDILDTPCGQIAYQLGKYGFKFGISSRGEGDLITDFSGEESVDPDTYTLNAFDLVLIPACEDARLQFNESLDTKKSPSLRTILGEALENASDSDRRIMEEALDEIDKYLAEEQEDDGIIHLEYTYDTYDDTTDICDHNLRGHINVRANSEEEAIKKAEDYVNNYVYGEYNAGDFRVTKDRYTNVKLIEDQVGREETKSNEMASDILKNKPENDREVPEQEEEPTEVTVKIEKDDEDEEEVLTESVDWDDLNSTEQSAVETALVEINNGSTIEDAVHGAVAMYNEENANPDYEDEDFYMEEANFAKVLEYVRTHSTNIPWDEPSEEQLAWEEENLTEAKESDNPFVKAYNAWPELMENIMHDNDINEEDYPHLLAVPEDLQKALTKQFLTNVKDKILYEVKKGIFKDTEIPTAAIELFKKYKNESLQEANGNDPHDRVELEKPYRALEFYNGEISISSIHPYDDANYYYAAHRVKDPEDLFLICRDGMVVEEVTETTRDGSYQDVVDRLKELDATVNPRMLYDSLNEDAYTRDELFDKFGTDDLDIINAGNEETVELEEAVIPDSADILDSGYCNKDEWPKIKKEQENKFKHDYKNVKCVLQKSDTEGLRMWATYTLDESVDIAADDDGAIVEQLQNILKENKSLENKVKALQEKISAGYAKEMSLKEELDNYKQKASKLSEKSKEIKVLKEKLSKAEAIVEENKSKAKDNISTLNESIEAKASENKTLRKDISVLNEALDKKNSKIKSLNEQISNYKDELRSRDADIEQLKEQYETGQKDLEQLKNRYSKKLEEQNQTIEKYQRVAKNSVKKYIESQAIRLGVKSDEIVNRLPKNYSFNDIDVICEDLQEYKFNISNLPFGQYGLNENLKVTAKNISTGLVEANPDDEITDYDLKIAEAFL